MSESLASPTLALLYLAQGHPKRARTTLDEVLEHEPNNGHALALLRRLREDAEATLALRFVPGALAAAGELELRWSVPARLPDLPDPDPDRSGELDVSALHLVLGITRLHDPKIYAGLRYTSVPCAALEGTTRIPAPLGPASASVALVYSLPRRPLHVLSFAPATSW